MTDETLRWDRIGLNYLYQIRDINIDELDDYNKQRVIDSINNFINDYTDEVDDSKFKEDFESYLDSIAILIGGNL